MEDWRQLLHTRSHRDEMPLKPQVVANALNDLLADDAIVSTDSGTITTWAARYIQLEARADVLVLRQFRQHGAWSAIRDRRAGRIPGQAIGCVRRRWRLHDVDGRIRHRREISASDQGRHHQEQYARA